MKFLRTIDKDAINIEKITAILKIKHSTSQIYSTIAAMDNNSNYTIANNLNKEEAVIIIKSIADRISE